MVTFDLPEPDHLRSMPDVRSSPEDALPIQSFVLRATKSTGLRIRVDKVSRSHPTNQQPPQLMPDQPSRELVVQLPSSIAEGADVHQWRTWSIERCNGHIDRPFVAGCQSPAWEYVSIGIEEVEGPPGFGTGAVLTLGIDHPIGCHVSYGALPRRDTQCWSVL